MSKCSQCRDKDAELLTRWERFRNWLFFRVSYVFFPEDLNDLISQKYTQGYSDGLQDATAQHIEKMKQFKQNYGD